MTKQKKLIVPNEEEKIIQIEIERLTTFKDHPFKVQEDEDMKMLIESIEKYGILNPLIVRPLKEGVYEIVSGHRRRYAAEKLGYRKVPVIIRVMRDEESVIAMVDANLQRESISFSEKAFAYKMKNDAMKRVRGRKKQGQIDDNLLGKRTIEIIAEESGESYKQIQRYIKVTALHPKLLEMLDKDTGEVQHVVMVDEAEPTVPSETPKTGDERMVEIWLLLLGAGIVGIAVSYGIRRKRK